MIWAAAFDVTASAIKTQSPIAAPKEQAKPVEQKPVVYVQGDIDDYDVVQKSDGYYITHFNGFEEEVMTIPSMIDGKRIKGIARDAFQGCISVKQILISEGIEIIESCAFKGCSSLTEIILPETLRKLGDTKQELGEGAFANTNLTRIEVPSKVSYIGPYTFYGCRELKEIKLPNGLTEINVGVFCGCSKLSKIDFPMKLKTIKTAAFDDCKALSELHIPFGVQTIEENAFHGSRLSSVYIPPTVTSIAQKSSAPNWYMRSSWGRDETFGWVGTIFCTAGSAAMEYARKNNIKCAKAQF